MADTSSMLTWTGEGLAFAGRARQASLELQAGADRVRPSPMELVLSGVAGCMAADVIEILAKMRKPVTAYVVEAEAWRAAEPPRKFLRIRLTHRLKGGMEESAARRAIDMSQSRFCSAVASLDPAIVIENEVVVEEP